MRKKQMVSMEDIARETGFHVSTVSRVLNNDVQISSVTARKIIRAARASGYAKESEWKEVGILLPDSTTALALYSLNILNALRRKVDKYGIRLTFFHADQLEMLNDRVVAGVISLDFICRSAETFSSRFNLPLVCINDKPLHLSSVYMVSSDENQGIAASVKYLFRRGHRKKIGLLVTGSSDSFCNSLRLAAFREVCEKYGIGAEVLFWQECRQNTKACAQLDSLLKTGISALIVNGENHGPRILYLLQKMGVSIPRELSLIAWEVPGLSAFFSPPLTTLEQNYDALAASALELLIALIGKKPVSDDVLVPYRFHSRKSVRTLHG